MMQSQTVSAIIPALVKAQSKFQNIAMDMDNTFKGYKYASLGAVLAHVRPILTDCGLAVTQHADSNDDVGVTVVTVLWHVSGEFLGTELTLKPKDNSAQSIGSAITYNRRYALSALLGIATEQDDDAVQAQGGDARQTAPRHELVSKQQAQFAKQQAQAAKAKAPAKTEAPPPADEPIARDVPPQDVMPAKKDAGTAAPYNPDSDTKLKAEANRRLRMELTPLTSVQLQWFKYGDGKYWKALCKELGTVETAESVYQALKAGQKRAEEWFATEKKEGGK